MKKIILLILLLSLTGILFSQEYFPLQVGNLFQYYYEHAWGSLYGSGKSKAIAYLRVIDSATFFNRKYFYCIGFREFSNAWLRVDSTTGSLYRLDTTNSCSLYYKETLIDSLGMPLPGGVENYCSGFTLISFHQDSLFPTNQNITFQKYFKRDTYGMTYNHYHRLYNSQFGLKKYQHQWSTYTQASSWSWILMGCKINGAVYGIITFADTKQLSKVIPEHFSLEQNYPNPFNSMTKVKFQISNAEDVKLIVFDLLGREVATLVNEKLQPGTYETTFNAGDITSGIYFYRLQTNSYTETKRMTLVK